ncbi:hypothetical protein ACOME3_001267 [Neoechinorhynchus agilis]
MIAVYQCKTPAGTDGIINGSNPNSSCLDTKKLCTECDAGIEGCVGPADCPVENSLVGCNNAEAGINNFQCVPDSVLISQYLNLVMELIAKNSSGLAETKCPDDTVPCGKEYGDQCLAKSVIEAACIEANITTTTAGPALTTNPKQNEYRAAVIVSSVFIAIAGLVALAAALIGSIPLLMTMRQPAVGFRPVPRMRFRPPQRVALRPRMRYYSR